MIGISIEDPQGVENQGAAASQAGLGLLPVRTLLRAEKTVRRVRGCLRSDPFGAGLFKKTDFEGYEIHVGETFYETGAQPFAEIIRQELPGSVPDGAVSASSRVFGSYVHGLFDNDDFRHSFIQAARTAVDLAPAETWAHVAAEREARIDRLASHLKKSLDMDRIKSWLVDPPTCRGDPNCHGRTSASSL
jgi:adenosylcobyric acid synthase